jgi:uroporphyrinogen-III synthase
MSRGPNSGRRVLARTYDILAFSSSRVWPLFLEACKAFNRRDLLNLALNRLQRNAIACQNKRINKFLQKKGSLYVASLLFLPDKAGKTRVVYCLTWWFQE